MICTAETRHRENHTRSPIAIFHKLFDTITGPCDLHAAPDLEHY
jgi:hypothetical protein